MSAVEDRASGVDAKWHSAIAQLTGGLSPAALATAYLDWALHLIASPDKQAELLKLAMPGSIASKPSDDPRFSDPEWSVFPFNAIAQGFLTTQIWWDVATRGIAGVEPKHANIVNFAARQWLDMLSPSNFAATNPVVQTRTQQEMGHNLIRGARYWMEDFNRLITNRRRIPEEHVVGKDLATTPGDVIYRNRLIELIRYRPTTNKVHPEPILIVPAWIMKFYILDLTDTRSLVAYLRDKGFEAFILSWKNSDAGYADLSMQDYIDFGPRCAVEVIKELGRNRIHAVGYCLGGTLLTIAAAAMARDEDDTFVTLSLLASQVDFSEPGEIGLFINESQVAFLEDMMATKGYLKADQMAGAFQLLRSNDLIWSRVIRHYLLGERTPGNALMAWNADATRLPARMHSDYLRHLFLHNDLAKARYKVDGESVSLTDIRCPIYCVGTEEDHVSPWKSVYRLSVLTDTEVTFALTNGGHNGGILSEPGHPGRHFRVGRKSEASAHMSPDTWWKNHDPKDGSWWINWVEWLKIRSGDMHPTQQDRSKTLGPAPGRYVFE